MLSDLYYIIYKIPFLFWRIFWGLREPPWADPPCPHAPPPDRNFFDLSYCFKQFSKLWQKVYKIYILYIFIISQTLETLVNTGLLIVSNCQTIFCYPKPRSVPPLALNCQTIHPRFFERPQALSAAVSALPYCQRPPNYANDSDNPTRRPDF